MPVSKPIPNTNYVYWCSSRLFSVHPGICWVSIPNYATASFFHSSSYSLLTNFSTIRCSIIWDTVNFPEKARKICTSICTKLVTHNNSFYQFIQTGFVMTTMMMMMMMMMMTRSGFINSFTTTYFGSNCAPSSGHLVIEEKLCTALRWRSALSN